MVAPLSEQQIAELYQKHGHALYKRCLRLVSHPDDARELVQETFCQFCTSKFKGESSVFTFLYRIATNLSIDRLRRRTTAGVVVELGEDLEVTGRSQEQATAALQELVRLTDGLDEDTLTIAVMSHVDGLTQDEIAEALDLSRKTIGKKLQKFLDLTRGRI